jgi:hypothetical protein
MVLRGHKRCGGRMSARFSFAANRCLGGRGLSHCGNCTSSLRSQEKRGKGPFTNLLPTKSRQPRRECSLDQAGIPVAKQRKAADFSGSRIRFGGSHHPRRITWLARSPRGNFCVFAANGRSPIPARLGARHSQTAGLALGDVSREVKRFVSSVSSFFHPRAVERPNPNAAQRRAAGAGHDGEGAYRAMIPVAAKHRSTAKAGNIESGAFRVQAVVYHGDPPCMPCRRARGTTLPDRCRAGSELLARGFPARLSRSVPLFRQGIGVPT